MNREEMISKCIEDRVNKKETIKCIFDVTVPQCLETRLEFNKHVDIKEVCGIFDKYSIKYETVDSMPGAFNLDRMWLDTDIETPIECAIEYCGVYPVNWDIKDVIKLEKMECSGKIIIKVSCITADGDLALNC